MRNQLRIVGHDGPLAIRVRRGYGSALIAASMSGRPSLKPGQLHAPIDEQLQCRTVGGRFPVVLAGVEPLLRPLEESRRIAEYKRISARSNMHHGRSNGGFASGLRLSHLLGQEQLPLQTCRRSQRGAVRARSLSAISSG